MLPHRLAAAPGIGLNFVKLPSSANLRVDDSRAGRGFIPTLKFQILNPYSHPQTSNLLLPEFFASAWAGDGGWGAGGYQGGEQIVAEADDAYQAACQLAQMVGVDLMDG